jgi:hypothetical protein
MIVRFDGIDNMSLVNGRQYAVDSTECGWYRIFDEAGDDYLFPPQSFTVVEGLPAPPETYPEKMPADMLQTA